MASAPGPDHPWLPVPGQCCGEYAVLAGPRDARKRLLVIPALFAEASLMRRFTLALLHHLGRAGWACLLPDLPGTNESAQPLDAQSLTGWRHWVAAAAQAHGATHVLAIRAGALLAPPALPACALAPIDGAVALRALLRAAVLGANEVGEPVTREILLDQGRREGVVLAGWTLGAALLAELEAATIPAGIERIESAVLGGGGLWLRAEPGHDEAQATRLAAWLAGKLA